MTLRAVLTGVATRPDRFLVERWNWKSAVLGTAIRGAVFFFTNLAVSVSAAERALVVDMSFRAVLAGVCGGLTQSFASVEPAPLGTLASVVIVPLVAHTVELATHAAAGTPALGASVMASVGLSMVSSAFHVFAARRGVLVVGEEVPTLWDDLRRVPLVLAHFVWEAPAALVRRWAFGRAT